MTLPRRSAEILRRWLLPACLLAFAPKCAACLLAYAGLGLAAGWGGPELCGAIPDATLPWHLLPPALGGVLALAFLARQAAIKLRSSQSS